MKISLIATIVLLSAVSLSANAEVYKKIDQDGNVSFTDVPTSKDQKAIHIDPPMTYESKPITPQTPSSAEESDESGESETTATAETQIKYEILSINTPTNDENLRDNGGNVAVSLSSQPDLDRTAQHQYILYLDGKKVSESQSSTTSLANTDRGTHTLIAEIVDKEQNTLIKSDSITFHLQRVALRPRVSPR